MLNSNKPKIAIIMPWFTPAFKAGGPIRSIHNLVYRLCNKFDFFIVTSNTDLNDEPLNNITSNSWVTKSPGINIYYSSKNATALPLRELSKHIKPHKIFIIGIFSWQFNFLPLIYLRSYAKILSTRGMLCKTCLARGYWKKLIYLQLLKPLLCKNTVFHATDNIELDDIKGIFGKNAPIKIAENYPSLFFNDVKRDYSKTLKLCTISIISYKKNHLKVIRALKNINTPVVYNIYGPVRDDKYWQECLINISTLPTHITVCYKNAIKPDEVKIALEENDVFILPTDNENYCHAIPEALSAGLPCIISNNTPWKNLSEYNAGSNLQVDEQEIADAITAFANMTVEQKTNSSNCAIAYIKGKINLEDIDNQYKLLLCQ